MPNFVVAGQELTDRYLTDTEIIDRYVGNQLWAWGNNFSGRLGDNTVTDRSSPVQTVSGGTNWQQVSFGDTFSTAIKTDGTLWSWGTGTSGQLGNNSNTNRSSPVQTVSGGTDWKQVSAGGSHCAAIKTDGRLWLWGFNSSGQLGDNSTTTRSSPVQTVSAGTNWKQVSAGQSSTGAIKTDGTLWVWGSNTQGQLGTNDRTNRSSPVQTVSAGTDWKQVSMGFFHSGAIKTDGTLWMWGQNAYGVLGLNDINSRSSPVQIFGGGTNWKQVACSEGGDNQSMHTAAIKTDGTLWTWGNNSNGQLGDNTIVHRSSPVQTVAGGTNWKQVSTGVRVITAAGGTTAAVKTDGTLWLWGWNVGGQLGTNNITHRSSPVQTVAGGTNWKQVTTGSTTLAVTFMES